MASAVKIVIEAKDKTKKGLMAPIKSLKDLNKAVDDLKPAFKALALAGTAAFAAIAKSSVDAVMDMIRVKNAMFVATGSAAGVAKGMSMVREMSDRLGVSLLDTAKGYSKIAAAAKGTALEGQASVDILEGISQAASALSLTGDETAGVLKALEQMISKGKVTSDELSEQLGDRLPGALRIAGRAMGMTTMKLRKQMELGKVMADDFLPKLAAEMKRTFGDAAAEASKSAIANMNRFNNTLLEFKVLLGTGVLPVVNDFVVGIVEMEKETGKLTATAETLVGIIDTLARSFSGVSSIMVFIANFAAEMASMIISVFESLGKVLETSMAGIGSSVLHASEALKRLKDRDLAGFSQSWKDSVSSIKDGLLGVGPAFKSELDTLLKDSKDATDRLVADALSINDAFIGKKSGGGDSDLLGDKAKNRPTADDKNIPGIGDPEGQSAAADSFIEGLKAKFQQLTLTKMELLELEKQKNAEFIENNIKNYEDYTQATIQSEALFRSKKAELIAEELEKELEAKAILQALKDEEMAAAEAELERKVEVGEFLRELENQARLTTFEGLAEERAIAVSDHEDVLERIGEIAKTEEEARTLKLAAEALQAARIAAIEKKAAKDKDDIQKHRQAVFSKSLGEMAGASAAFFGKESAAYKAFAIGEALMNTYRGANQTLGDPKLGFYQKIFAVAATVTMGLSNVAQISGVAHGGITEVPSDQTFLLKKSERVLSPDQNSDFTSFMEDGGGGQSIDLSINIDGQALYDAIAKASGDGRFMINARAIA